MRFICFLILLLVIAFLTNTRAPAQELQWILPLHAEHFGGKYNEKNPGLGVAYSINNTATLSGQIMLDSYDNWMGYVGYNQNYFNSEYIDFGLSYGVVVGHTKLGTTPALLPYLVIKTQSNVNLNVVFLPRKGQPPIILLQLLF